MKKLMRKLEALLEKGGTKKDIIFLAISGVALLLSIFKVLPKIFPGMPFDIAWVSIILCGVPIVLEALIGLITEFDIKADVLVSIALIASVCIGEYFAAGEVAFIMQLGGLLEELTVARARAGIEKLVHLTPTTARRLVNGKEEIIAADAVEKGDLLKVLPGETIPVDGVIVKGQTSINQAVMTGESLPVDKTVGDEVSSGTVNQFGAFEMEATKVGEDSSIQRMIRLVQSADAGKAKIVGMADRWATWIVVTALTAAVLTGVITHFFMGFEFQKALLRSVTILVVFCPCSLVLATPTAIMAAIGNATKHGFLVREGDALERLAKVKKVTFDKTGTLTVGVPKVTLVQSLSSYSEAELYAFAAAVEKNSEHPLGKAIVTCYKTDVNAYRKIGNLPDDKSGDKKEESQETKSEFGKNRGSEIKPVENFEMLPGRGVSGTVDGHTVFAGNEKMMAEASIAIPEEASLLIEEQLKKGCTVTLLAVDSVFAGVIALADSVRAESRDMISRLKTLGVTPVLLTGDNEAAAMDIASTVSISEVKANCLPEDKLNYIGQCQKEEEAVCMIGDGINDAPALKKANVGIAMGGVGSDIAVDAADIALVDDDIKELPQLFALSKKMMRKITFNLSFSMALNFIAIVLAITGVLNPVVGALVHNTGSVFVIVNSAFLLTYKKRFQ